MQAFVTGGSGFLGGRLIAELVKRGHKVHALARSEKAVRAVEALGARAVRGDLDDPKALEAGARGAQLVYHCAALAEEWGPWEDFLAANVQGTRNVARAARAAGARLLHVSTEAILAGRPMVRVDEAVPPPARALGHYAESKRQAEEVIHRGLGEGLDAVIVRPRFIWGLGDTSLLPKLVAKVKSGQFAWLGGGLHLTSSCHVANCIEGMLVAAERGKKGEVYYLTDGPPRPMKELLGGILSAAGAPPGERVLPLWAARILAAVGESLWRVLRLRGAPPLTRMALKLVGEEVTVVDSKARRELGYTPRVTVEEGLRELAEAAQGCAKAAPSGSSTSGP